MTSNQPSRTAPEARDWYAVSAGSARGSRSWGTIGRIKTEAAPSHSQHPDRVHEPRRAHSHARDAEPDLADHEEAPSHLPDRDDAGGDLPERKEAGRLLTNGDEAGRLLPHVDELSHALERSPFPIELRLR